MFFKRKKLKEKPYIDKEPKKEENFINHKPLKEKKQNFIEEERTRHLEKGDY